MQVPLVELLQNKTSLEKNLFLLEVCYHDPDKERAQEALWRLEWHEPELLLTELAKLQTLPTLRRVLLGFERQLTTNPVFFALLVALAANRPELLDNADEKVVMVLFQLAKSETKKLPQRAEQALLLQKDLATQEFICSLALNGDILARRIVIKKKIYPQDLHKRALFFFLTAQWVNYEKLDFDNRLLKVVYQNAPETLRNRIVEVGRQAGRPEMTRIIGGEKIKQLTKPEWEVVLRALTATARWPEVWETLQNAPPVYSVWLLKSLFKAGWQPETAAEREKLAELSVLARDLKLEFLENTFTDETFRGIVAGIYRKGRNLSLSRIAFGSTLAPLTKLTPEGYRPQLTEFALSENPYERYLSVLIRAQNITTREYFNTEAIWDLSESRLISNTANIYWQAFKPWAAFMTQHPYISFRYNYKKNERSGIDDKNLRLAQLKGRSEVSYNYISHNYKKPYCVAITEDGTRLFTGHYRIIAVWDLVNQKFIKAYEAHTGEVCCLKLNEENNTLTSLDSTGEIKVWHSPLTTLLYTPIEKMAESQLTDLEKLVEKGKLYEPDIKWLEFSRRLYKARFRYEIEIADIPSLEASYFDIELELDAD